MIRAVGAAGFVALVTVWAVGQTPSSDWWPTAAVGAAAIGALALLELARTDRSRKSAGSPPASSDDPGPVEGPADPVAEALTNVDTLQTQLEQVEIELAWLRNQLEPRSASLLDAVSHARAAQMAAEHANEFKDRFLANMSHELRTPLNAIIGYTELVQEELITSQLDLAEDCERVLDASHLLLQLIDDVLDLSKLNAGRVVLANERIEIRALIDEVASSVRPLAQKRGLEIDIEVDVDQPIWADPVRVRQILLNLASNACKFTDEGSVSLRVSSDGPDFRFEVEDTGIGISETALDRIFEPFEQADATTTRRFGGTGLGLAIVRRLTHLMGGSIEVRSVLGSGSRFVVTLPARAPADAREPVPAAPLLE